VLPPEKVKADRLAWNLKTLVEPYEKAGHTDPKWDRAAKQALTEFARLRSQLLETNELYWQIIATNCDLAAEAGCDDPMIAYLRARFSLNQTNSGVAFVAAFSNAAESLQQSSYPDIRKFYACFRAAQQIQYTWGTNQSAEENYFWSRAITNLSASLQDQSMPVPEVDDACNEAADQFMSDRDQRKAFYYQVEVPLFNHWHNASVCWLLKGKYEIDSAWAARGSGYRNSVTDEGWKLFGEHLSEAEKSLTQAWELKPENPRIPIQMITVDLGQGKDRNEMELWFGRAMKLDTNSYAACSAKLYYLEPKWYGSEEDMLAFGRECVASREWGGRVPLILTDAHEAIRRYLEKSEQDDYWKHPDVWPDIEAAFNRFFELNPEATRWYHNYARYAYLCEQWGKLNELIPKLGPVNYDYFGGQEEFDRMVRRAQAHARDANADDK
jgi:hypothetical protein